MVTSSTRILEGAALAYFKCHAVAAGYARL